MPVLPQAPDPDAVSPRSTLAGVAAAAALLILVACEDGRLSASARPIDSARRPPPPPSEHSLWLLHEHAIAAFVVPLLDDGEPPRWADHRHPLLCGEGSEVRVDGAPLRPGEAVPARAFTLHWEARQFCPFGPIGPSFDGRVDVLVIPDDDRGLTALVQPQQLTLTDAQGTLTLGPQAPVLIAYSPAGGGAAARATRRHAP